MDEERMRVLKMIEEGKVTPQEGARLIEAIRKREEKVPEAGQPPKRCLRVRVFEGDTQNPKVNITVPLVLGRLGLKFIPPSAQEAMAAAGMTVEDLEELLAEVEKAGPFRIVDVQEEDTKVEVFIE